ncbi:MAG TPA: hypothetical protein VG963_04810, partial [Polyangiaceae bacterium]|nr:hypothetical protein [Polyangiaceae bacterium]
MMLPRVGSNAAPADHAAPGLLERLLRAGMISALDSHFARALAALGEASETVLASAALASRAVQLGHVCLDLESVHELANAERARLERRPGELDSPPELPPPAELRAALRA